MSGIAACSQYSVTPPVAPVSLTDQSVSDHSSTTATASYTIASDGKVKNQNSAILETWLTSGSASSYEVRATAFSGSVTSGTTGSWLNCSTNRSWSISNGAQDNSTLSVGLTVQIRDVATSTVQATATIFLSAESFNFN